MQESPGVFNEVTFRALDWLLDEARRHGIRVILSFVDNWKYPGALGLGFEVYDPKFQKPPNVYPDPWLPFGLFPAAPPAPCQEKSRGAASSEGAGQPRGASGVPAAHCEPDLRRCTC